MGPLIIHISGPSGADESTLGAALQKRFGNRIVVYNLDDLRGEFIYRNYGPRFYWKDFDSNLYQTFLDECILTKKKPLILVGSNYIPQVNEKSHYNLHAHHNYYMDMDDVSAIKGKCSKFLTDKSRDIMFYNGVADGDIMKYTEGFVESIGKNIKMHCGAKEILRLNKMWRKDYEKQGYRFMSRESIYRSIVMILRTRVSK